MTEQEYFPICNSGETMSVATKKDAGRLYYNLTVYEIKDLYLLSDFELFNCKRLWDGEFLLLMVDGNIDYDVLTSLN